MFRGRTPKTENGKITLADGLFLNMEEMAEKYPQYRFERHKGYGTRLHYEMLEQYGPSPIHRKSFLKKWEAGRHG